jgi:recombination associated protein RdgC
MFRNFRLYRVESDWPDAEETLSDLLAIEAFKPCGAFQERSLGFESPIENAGDRFCRRVMAVDLLELRIQSRILPPAAIREALVERVQTFKQRTSRDPGRAEKRELKEEVYAELLPKSLLKSERVRALYLAKDKVLAVGTTSVKHNEGFFDRLGGCIKGLRVSPIEFRLPAEQFMTRLFNGDGPAEFAVGRECRMQNPGEGAASVTWLDMDIGDRTARQMLQSGLKIDRLGFTLAGILQGTLDKEWAFRKFKLEGQEAVDELEGDDPIARFDAELAIFGGALMKLINALKQ